MYSWSNTNITWSNIVQYTLPECAELLANYCSVDEEIKQRRFMYSRDARFHRSRRTRANDIQTIEKQERCMSINTSNPFSPSKSVILRQTTFSRRDRSPFNKSACNPYILTQVNVKHTMSSSDSSFSSSLAAAGAASEEASAAAAGAAATAKASGLARYSLICNNRQ